METYTPYLFSWNQGILPFFFSKKQTYIRLLVNLMYTVNQAHGGMLYYLTTQAFNKCLNIHKCNTSHIDKQPFKAYSILHTDTLMYKNMHAKPHLVMMMRHGTVSQYRSQIY